VDDSENGRVSVDCLSFQRCYSSVCVALSMLCEDGAAFTFTFEVKFYPPDVTSLQEDVTRFLCFIVLG